VYDGEGYNEAAYHGDTDLNREGVSRALDALESDENTEHGHIYAVPYLGRIVGPKTTIIIPPSLRATLADWKFWFLVALPLHILTPYGLIIGMHEFLMAARGYAYNGWGLGIWKGHSGKSDLFSVFLLITTSLGLRIACLPLFSRMTADLASGQGTRLLIYSTAH
jgi:hypothetical protein